MDYIELNALLAAIENRADDAKAELRKLLPFDQVTSQLQILAQAYPIAAEELMSAGKAIARAMLKGELRRLQFGLNQLDAYIDDIIGELYGEEEES